MNDVARALVAYTWLTLVYFAGELYELRGLPMGGVMSSFVVALILAYAETTWLAHKAAHRSMGLPAEPPIEACVQWVRYVDDLLMLSFCYCPACLMAIVAAIFPVPCSPCSGTPGKEADPHLWTDLELVVAPSAVPHACCTPAMCRQRICIIPKNVNRMWLHNSESPKKENAVIPWPDRPPQGFNTALAIMTSRIERSYVMGVTLPFIVVFILESIYELFLHGYPGSVLRALVHALPTLPASIVARKAVRTWLADMVNDDSKSNTK